MSILSSSDIEEHLNSSVIINPFNPARLGTNTYDVSLGEFYFRSQRAGMSSQLYNPYCEEDVRNLWGSVQSAETAQIEFHRQHHPIPKGIHPEDRVILLGPGEMILAHTQEFIGGRNGIVGWMQGKSGWSRSFISVCTDAGLGDIGFVSRWTMELENRHDRFTIPLVVGLPIAKIAFLDSGNRHEMESVTYAGNYQKGKTLEEIKKSWTPENMLPRLYAMRKTQEGGIRVSAI